MDTLEIYVKKSEKAEEIQKISKKFWLGKELYEKQFYNEKIWLPRQDQLQEIYVHGGTPYGYTTLLNYFMKSNLIPDTMEQLWLAFVMKEKFNKRWDDEKWVTA